MSAIEKRVSCALKYTTSQLASGQNRYSAGTNRCSARSVSSALTVRSSTAVPGAPLAGQRTVTGPSAFSGQQQLDIRHSCVEYRPWCALQSQATRKTAALQNLDSGARSTFDTTSVERWG